MNLFINSINYSKTNKFLTIFLVLTESIPIITSAMSICTYYGTKNLNSVIYFLSKTRYLELLNLYFSKVNILDGFYSLYYNRNNFDTQINFFNFNTFIVAIAISSILIITIVYISFKKAWLQHGLRRQIDTIIVNLWNILWSFFYLILLTIFINPILIAIIDSSKINNTSNIALLIVSFIFLIFILFIEYSRKFYFYNTNLLFEHYADPAEAIDNKLSFSMDIIIAINFSLKYLNTIIYTVSKLAFLLNFLALIYSMNSFNSLINTNRNKAKIIVRVFAMIILIENFFWLLFPDIFASGSAVLKLAFEINLTILICYIIFTRDSLCTTQTVAIKQIIEFLIINKASTQSFLNLIERFILSHNTRCSNSKSCELCKLQTNNINLFDCNDKLTFHIKLLQLLDEQPITDTTITLKSVLLYIIFPNTIYKPTFYIKRALNRNDNQKSKNLCLEYNLKYFFDFIVNNNNGKHTQINEAENLTKYFATTELLDNCLKSLTDALSTLQLKNFSKHSNEIIKISMDLYKNSRKINKIFGKIAKNENSMFKYNNLKFGQMYLMLFNTNLKAYEKEDLFNSDFIDYLETEMDDNNRLITVFNFNSGEYVIKSFPKQLAEALGLDTLEKNLYNTKLDSFFPELLRDRNISSIDSYLGENTSKTQEIVIYLQNRQREVLAFYTNIACVPSESKDCYINFMFNFKKTEENIILIDQMGEIIKSNGLLNEFLAKSNEMDDFQIDNLNIYDIFGIKLDFDFKIIKNNIKINKSKVQILLNINKYSNNLVLEYDSTNKPTTNRIIKRNSNAGVYEIYLETIDIINRIENNFYVLKYEIKNLFMKQKAQDDALVSYKEINDTILDNLNKKMIIHSASSTRSLSIGQTILNNRRQNNITDKNPGVNLATRWILRLPIAVFVISTIIFITFYIDLTQNSNLIITYDSLVQTQLFYNLFWIYTLNLNTFLVNFDISRNTSNIYFDLNNLYPNINMSELKYSNISDAFVKMNYINQINTYYRTFTDNFNMYLMDNVAEITINTTKSYSIINQNGIVNTTNIDIETVAQMLAVYQNLLVNSQDRSSIQYIINKASINKFGNKTAALTDREIAFFNLMNNFSIIDATFQLALNIKTFALDKLNIFKLDCIYNYIGFTIIMLAFILISYIQLKLTSQQLKKKVLKCYQAKPENINQFNKKINLVKEYMYSYRNASILLKQFNQLTRRDINSSNKKDSEKLLKLSTDLSLNKNQNISSEISKATINQTEIIEIDNFNSNLNFFLLLALFLIFLCFFLTNDSIAQMKILSTFSFIQTSQFLQAQNIFFALKSSLITNSTITGQGYTQMQRYISSYYGLQQITTFNGLNYYNLPGFGDLQQRTSGNDTCYQLFNGYVPAFQNFTNLSGLMFTEQLLCNKSSIMGSTVDTILEYIVIQSRNLMETFQKSSKSLEAINKINNDPNMLELDLIVNFYLKPLIKSYLNSGIFNYFPNYIQSFVKMNYALYSIIYAVIILKLIFLSFRIYYKASNLLNSCHLIETLL